MSNEPVQFPGGKTNVPAGFNATFKCPYCDAERPPIMALNTVIPLNYFIGGNAGSISTLRSVVVCGACNCILSVQFLPVDLQATPVSGKEDDGTSIIV